MARGTGIAHRACGEQRGLRRGEVASSQGAGGLLLETEELDPWILRRRRELGQLGEVVRQLRVGRAAGGQPHHVVYGGPDRRG